MHLSIVILCNSTFVSIIIEPLQYSAVCCLHDTVSNRESMSFSSNSRHKTENDPLNVQRQTENIVK